MDYVKLMRCKHYIKNLLLFLPIFFSKNIFQIELLWKTIFGFISFCLISSVVYIFNDIMDAEKDKLHTIKSKRPIAAGKISKKKAAFFLILLLIISVCINVFILKLDITGYCLIALYVLLNFCYSIKLKTIPILDIAILATGFLIRLLFGTIIIQVPLSNLLYLTVLALSFYMSLGKRRNELIKLEGKAREVLNDYSKNFLDKNMYMCLGLAIVFYSLWCMEINSSMNSVINIIWTVPLVILIMMRYSLNIEKDSMGDPVDVILSDKILIALTILFAVLMLFVVYFNQ